MFSLHSNKLKIIKHCKCDTTTKKCITHHVCDDFYIYYLKRNVRTRPGLPAYIISSTVFNMFRRYEYYLFNGQLHRIGGPARIGTDEKTVFSLKYSKHDEIPFFII